MTADDLTRLRDALTDAESFAYGGAHKHFRQVFDVATCRALIDRVERAERERDELRKSQVRHARQMEAKDAELAALRAAVEGLADATGSAFPYVQVRELRALLTEGADDGQ